MKSVCQNNVFSVRYISILFNTMHAWALYNMSSHNSINIINNTRLDEKGEYE